MTPDTVEPPRHDALLDVGDTLCGELALMLKIEINKLEPGQVVKVIARDPAAPQDIPAWCALTGHAILLAEHPNYWIQRKAE
jgi:tRNA 2-thiouridine synthesizing protein A